MSQGKRILIVDDDETTLMLTRIFLESMSLNDVHSSSNGQEALDFITANCLSSVGSPEKCPDVVLLDLNMPVMDGYEFLEEFNSMEELKERNIRIVVVSSSDSKRDREKAAQFNVAGYLVKPLTEEKLRPFLT